MFKDHWDRFWPLLAGAILVLVVLSAVFGDAFFLVVCGDGGNCARTREWVGALSGWVAAAAAGATIYVLLDQLKIQREQLDFQIGDAKPTIEAFPSERLHRGFVRLVNWNRRSMEVIEIEVLECASATRGSIHYGWKPYQEVRTDSDSLVPAPPLHVPGWENRSEKPPSVKIELLVFTGVQPREFEWREVPVKVYCRMFGERETEFTVEVRLSVYTT